MTQEQTQHRTRSSARLRFVLGERSIDITVPAEIPIADLLPAVLSHFGGEAIEQGVEHEGWVLQRLGDPPFDEERTTGELGLRDGEVVYVRPRADELAPIDYDDVVDGVAEQVRAHPWSWSDSRTRAMLRLLAAIALLTGAPLVMQVTVPALALALAAAIAVMLLGAAGLVARSGVGTVPAAGLAGVAVCYAATAGVLLIRLIEPAAPVMTVVACAAALGLMALAVGTALVADGALLFIGAATAGLVAAAAGLAGALGGVSAPKAAAIAVVLSLVAGVFVPSTAFRLSGLQLPLLPGEPEQLTDDVEPVPHALVVERGTATVGYTAALHVGLGAAQLVLLPVVLVEGTVWAVVFVLVVAALMALRTRHLDSVVARWSALAPVVTALVVCAVGVAPALSPTARVLGLWLPVLAAGAVLAVSAERLPGHRLRPYWGRAVEIVESLTAVAVLPLLLQVLGVFAWMRGLAG
ncbi:type VII secretion integral membrane protein EccD [Pseudonocardia sp. ICBG1122]|nr:type VII secretion integral membrane protein EccD [Pseudonocardia pini]